MDQERKKAVCLLEAFLKRLIDGAVIEKYKKNLSDERDRATKRRKQLEK